MVKSCAAFGCPRTATAANLAKGYSFHRFPLSDDRLNREAEGVLAGNRLRREHIPEWNKHIMKVKFAVQALSRSTADALQFCHDVGISNFEDVEGTVTFIKIMDRAFDMNNSRSLLQSVLKLLCDPTSCHCLSLSFMRQRQLSWVCMKPLESTNQYLALTRKACIIGYVSLMRSTIALAHELFEEQPPMRYLLTYWLCQDRIEHLFRNIRSWCGFNNNPTPQQFHWAYWQIVQHKLPLETLSIGRNCLTAPTGNLEEDGADPWTERIPDPVELHMDYWTTQILNTFVEQELSEFKNGSLYYLSGWIAHALSQRVRCKMFRLHTSFVLSSGTNHFLQRPSCF